jgi:hypothetical protein
VVVDVSKGYSSVNQLSLLPENVRTATNLVGDTVPGDQEALLEKYRKERADYELKQLQKMEELKAKREEGPSQAAATAEAGQPGYEEVSIQPHSELEQGGQSVSDPYASPADAVPRTPGKVGGAKKSPKKLSVGTGVLATGDNYTPVFNTLPTGHVQRVSPAQGPGRTTRALSDSSPAAQSPKALVASYENTSPPKDGSEQVGATGGAGIGDRKDRNRQSSRGHAKEVVELDPNRKKFRMTSDVRKKSDQRSMDCSDQPDGGSQESEGAAHVPSRPFSIHTEDQGKLSYALVNMDDKMKYRLETGAIKSEGSGTPQHYRVPIASS